MQAAYCDVMLSVAVISIKIKKFRPTVCVHQKSGFLIEK
jgi:hypothetical protein